MNWGKVVFLGLVIAVALTAYAVGAGSRSSKTVVFCAAKKSGEVTLAGNRRCGKGEKKISIAKQGPKGPAGAVGPAGAPAVSPPLEAAHLVAPATVACEAEPGTFCVTESGFCWNNGNYGNGQAPVSYRKDSDGFVHLEGTFRNFNGEGAGCGSSRPVFYLPPGFRPGAGNQAFVAAAVCGEQGFGFIHVATDGLVDATIGCLHLDGIVFRADA